MSAVAQQPVSVAIQADQSAFQLYSSGVLTATCGTQLDHGVLVVGYGTLNGTDYWKVRNSWGTSYGMEGYVLLQRGTASAEVGDFELARRPGVEEVLETSRVRIARVGRLVARGDAVSDACHAQRTR